MFANKANSQMKSTQGPLRFRRTIADKVASHPMVEKESVPPYFHPVVREKITERISADQIPTASRQNNQPRTDRRTVFSGGFLEELGFVCQVAEIR